MMTNDLLHDPLIQTDQDWHSLPGLLAAMVRGEVANFPALRPHQRPAWHMFLVQLAVLALDAAGKRDLPQTEGEWRAALRGLTIMFPGDEPWHLLGRDRRLPAFLQPPDPGGLKWTDVATPDALDMLITSRNHDVKREIAHNAAPQDWVYALVSLQTMEGLLGRGNYGIVRMNSGYSSRSMITLAPAVGVSSEINPSTWWQRDIRRLLSGRNGVAGKALLWIEPWAEGNLLNLGDLDRLFIEVCRRIRLDKNAGHIFAHRSTSNGPRIDATEVKGNTDDPWSPVHKTAGHSYSLAEDGWTAKEITKLLFGTEWKVPDLYLPGGNEISGSMILVLEAFARGQGKTGGFHSKVVPVPKAMVRATFSEKAVSVADGILVDIATVDQALRNSLATVAAGGSRDKKLDKSHYARSQPARDRLRRQADVMFFPEMWARMGAKVDADFAPIRLAFLEALATVARAEFWAAVPGIPCASLMRPRAEVRGKQALEWALHRAMRDLKPQEEVADA